MTEICKEQEQEKKNHIKIIYNYKCKFILMRPKYILTRSKNNLSFNFIPHK